MSSNWFSPRIIRLDYPGVGPEHSFLKDLGRAEYHSITDEEALEGDKWLHLLLVQSFAYNLDPFEVTIY